MSEIKAYARRLERLRERLHITNTRLPVRYYSDAGALLYQTPGYEDQPRVPWKVYVGMSPDEDGIEP